MEEPDFWDNPEKAQEQMKELGSLKEDRDTYRQLVSAKEDMETLIEMGYEENDPSVIPEIQEITARIPVMEITVVISKKICREKL